MPVTVLPFLWLLIVVGIVWFIAKKIVQKIPNVSDFSWIVDVGALVILLIGALNLFSVRI